MLRGFAAEMTVWGLPLQGGLGLRRKGPSLPLRVQSTCQAPPQTVSRSRSGWEALTPPTPTCGNAESGTGVTDNLVKATLHCTPKPARRVRSAHWNWSQTCFPASPPSLTWTPATCTDLCHSPREPHVTPVSLHLSWDKTPAPHLARPPILSRPPCASVNTAAGGCHRRRWMSPAPSVTGPAPQLLEFSALHLAPSDSLAS